jgi:hypothetical protein
MSVTEIKQIIKRELPTIMREDEEIRQFILHLTRTQFADKAETDSRFDRLLDELRHDREEQSRRWAEQNTKWDEQNRKWDENLEALRQDREEQSKRWAEQDAKWAEQNRKWDENQRVINQMLQEIQGLSRKHDSTIGALGARWGLYTEQSFRSALKAIMEESFAVEVQSVTEFDETGYVFGHPDQVELDIIIKDGLLIICEIKSSMSRSDMYAFGRKVEFYERGHQQKATRRLVISPMVDEYAQRVAKKLGIEVYSYAEAVEAL